MGHNERTTKVNEYDGVNVSVMRDYVTLDWDVPFATAPSIDVISERLGPWREIMRKAWVRKSASGNTHVLVEFRTELMVIQRFTFRGLMDDDPLRLMWDTNRCASNEAYFKSRFTGDLTDYSHGVLFDVKDGKEAGPWSEVALTT